MPPCLLGALAHKSAAKRIARETLVFHPSEELFVYSLQVVVPRDTILLHPVNASASAHLCSGELELNPTCSIDENGPTVPIHTAGTIKPADQVAARVLLRI